MVHLTKTLPVLALILVVACDAPDRQADPDVTGDTVPTVTAETHRQQVQVAVRDTRDRVDGRQARISERSDDLWDRISSRANETWREIESGLDGIRDDDPGSINRSREDAARRLAELQAELAEAEVATAQTPEELRDVTHDWLREIESDVSQLEQLLPQVREADRSDVDLDRDDLRDVRAHMHEIEADVREALADDMEDFGNWREDIARDLADLVQEVREAHYRLQWRHPGADRR